VHSLVAQVPLTQGVMEQLRVQMFRPDNQLAEEYVLQCKVRYSRCLLA